MSNVARVAGQAANTLVKPLNVEDVFSTYLYEGNGSTQTITNGIDLDGEGGLVWIKNRDFSDNHMLIDTERGNEYLISNENFDEAGTGTSFVTTSTGFNIVGSSFDDWNASGENYASWTWRKAPKFFDVVTYTGDGVAGRQIAHNLGSVPGCFILKATSTTGDWIVYHRGLSDPSNKALALHLTNAEFDNTYFNDTDPTATHFVVGGQGLGINNSGVSYVAYLFAHNDGDGEFGPDGDADIIKCGSYTSNNSTDGPEVDLGFEPQCVIIKMASDVADWVIFDNMRGVATGGNDAVLYPNKSDAEGTGNNFLEFTSTGFKLTSTGDEVNTASGSTYIYIAIRRGPMAVPESATDVFAISDRKNEIPSFPSGFPVDFLIGPRTINGADNNEVKTRLISGGYLRANTTDAEISSSQVANFAHNDGFFNFSGANANQYSWMWRRAPSFCDVVAYTGNGTAGRTVSHNLGVAPEMMWIKERDNATNWNVYHSGLNGGTTPQDYFIRLNLTNAEIDNSTLWNDTAPTSTQFTLGLASDVNGSNDLYIAYLFASLAGVSKVGSVSHTNGTNTVVDCGFSAGARFVLLKGIDLATGWFVLDTERGIVAGDDSVLRLDNSDAEASVDYVDPNSTGFEIAGQWLSTGTYLFYAIA